MCGIAISIGYKDDSIVKSITNAQHHRGPDSFGYWSNGSDIFFGHNRLSIIETSEASNQPLSIDNNSIIYNGELYNYREIRSELRDIGFIFRTDSDTEVILNSFLAWGEDCLDRFRGMFAFAIYSKINDIDEIFIARDRFGIKPVLFHEDNGRYIFSSELKGMLSTNHVKRDLSIDALNDYISYGYVSQPNTILKNVKCLEAGHFIRIKNGKFQKKAYYDLHEKTDDYRTKLSESSHQDLVSHFRKLLEDATKANLVSDVEVGTFLSGGVDSAAVLGLNNLFVNSIKTFSLGFEEIKDFPSETRLAKISANHNSANHFEKIISPSSEKINIDDVIRAIDQPSIDGINTWLVSKLASSEVKVVMSGLGGDELFGGYPHFNLKKPRLKRNLLSILTETFYDIFPNRFTFAIRGMFQDYKSFLNSLRKHITDSQKKYILNDHLISKGTPKRYCKDTFKDHFQAISYFEFNNYLKDSLLRDSDSMSMSHSLELRPILLDHHVVEFIYSLPTANKYNKSTPKSFFISSVEDLIHPKISKGRKLGFEMPFEHWLENDYKNDFLNLLNSQFSVDLFKSAYIEKIKYDLQERKTKRHYWALFILLKWLSINNININVRDE